MQPRHLAWASLRRRKGRFAFLLISLTLGIGTVVALASLSTAMRAAVTDELDRFGANIIVTPRSRSLDLGYGGLALGGVTIDRQELTIADAASVHGIPNSRNVSAVAPKLVGTVNVDGRAVVLVGADFGQERRVKSWWRVEGRFAASVDEIMLGSEAAASLHKRVGDYWTLPGGTARQVVGVISPTGAIEDQAVFADLVAVQQYLGRPDAVSFIEVSALCRGCPIEDMVAQIGAVIPQGRVAPIRQAVAAREQTVLQFTRFGYAIGVIVCLVGGLLVTTTMMASVTERTQEIGILRAIGFRQRQIRQVILLEALAVAVVGGITGWVAGSAVAKLLGPNLADLSAPIPLDFQLAGVAMALAVLMGAGGSTYPALRAARMDPTRALRHM